MRAITVAKYILWLGGQGGEDNDVSNMKLQKLLYYVQGFSLAMNGEPIFTDPIKAWDHGPVVPPVYEEYKAYGSNVIPPPESAPTGLNGDQRDLIEEVFDVYGQYAALRLRNMTHDETPWKATPRNGEISHEIMKSFFSTRICQE
jgi:uncharacterized phage-associated protein